VLSVLIAVAVVAASVRYRRNAWRAWVLLFAFVVLFDYAPVAIGRLYAWGPGLGFETRYVADAAPLLALCLGLAFIPLAGEREPWRRPPPAGAVVPAATGVLVGAFLVGSVLSVSAFRAQVHGARIHRYVEHVQAELRTVPATAEIHDMKVPRYVMLPDFGEYALISRVMAPVVSPEAERTLRSQPPYREPMIFDDEGRLRPMDVFLGAGSEPGPARGEFPGCWSVTDIPVDVPLKSDLRNANWWVRIGYIASQPAGITVQFGQQQVTLALDKGLHRIYVPMTGGGNRLWFTRLTPTAGICVGDVTVGIPTARAAS